MDFVTENAICILLIIPIFMFPLWISPLNSRLFTRHLHLKVHISNATNSKTNSYCELTFSSKPVLPTDFPTIVNSKSSIDNIQYIANHIQLASIQTWVFLDVSLTLYIFSDEILLSLIPDLSRIPSLFINSTTTTSVQVTLSLHGLY